MKKVITALFIIIIPLWIGFYIVAETTPEMDDSLKSEVLAMLELQELSPNVIKSITQLDLSDRNLLSIDGLAHFTNLEKLNISNNLLTDITAIKNLPNLVELNASFNQLEELSLQSPKLAKLNVEGNLLQSLTFIENLQTLQTLNVRDNRITDITPIENITELTKLNLRGNAIDSLEALTHLSMLDDVNIRHNNITSIEPLVALPLKDRLYVNGNDVKDLNLLKEKYSLIDEVDFELDIATPKLSKESGLYVQDFHVEITAEEETAIYYTLDGSIPTVKSQAYTGPINISNQVMMGIPVIANNKTSFLHEGYEFTPSEVKKAVTVTAIATYRKGSERTYSSPVTATYILDKDLFASKLPVISLTTDPHGLYNKEDGIFALGEHFEGGKSLTGNFFQTGDKFEREASMTFFEPDGTVDFEQQLGIRIQGRASRRFPQKSLRLYPRSEYGQSKIYTDIFENLEYREFDRLLLRTSGQDNNSTILRDGLMHELVKDLQVDVQAYQPVIVLINGEYWGIHNLRERQDASYLRSKYNVDEADVVLIDPYRSDGIKYEIKTGNEKDSEHFEDVIEFVQAHDLSKDENRQHVAEQIDIENFLHYVAYQTYYVNTDLFPNNTRIWRKRVDFMADAPVGHDGRWRWLLFDVDYGMGFQVHLALNYTGNAVDFNMFDFLINDAENMALFTNLMKNENVKNQFIQIMLKLLETNFEPATVKLKINDLAKTIRPEIGKSITRWGNINSQAVWEENIKVLHEFADKRPEIVKQQMMEQFELTKEELSEMKE